MDVHTGGLKFALLALELILLGGHGQLFGPLLLHELRHVEYHLMEGFVDERNQRFLLPIVLLILFLFFVSVSD